ncbi:E3 ubiquitin-protein ligase RNF220 [Bactrocera tryoni]|uniref:E3 ubiquitin-protein ligase RNF220 n=1 Tax=Bactrocera tryoni TaxID=59916 RepID=UPI001A95EB50|nr:E3 ubiquitin-protein ligase RNF220 [Bactrocera tryoni]
METTSETVSRLRSGGVGEEYMQCPTCECKLQHWEVKTHFEQEMERLRHLQMKAARETSAELSQQGASNTLANSEERRKPWTIFQRVQRNRHSRIRRRTGKRVAPANDHQCPVCNVSFPLEEIQQHAEQCLRRSNGTTNGRDGGSSSNEDDDGEEYEEYEWAGQKRIRVSSMLQGGYAAIGIGQTVTNTGSSGSHNSTHGGDEEEEEDLNVDEDDTQIYGPAQYAEADVIPPIAEQNGNSADSDVTSYMRRLITCSEGTALHNSVEEQRRTSVDIVVATNTEIRIPQVVESTGHQNPIKNKLPDNEQQNYPQIIESLKMKLRLFENQAQNKFKCLICLDDYKNPAISVACWHVHCEECWLRSLGARKLCPQCNLITTPKDLRRIYM